MQEAQGERVFTKVLYHFITNKNINQVQTITPLMLGQWDTRSTYDVCHVSTTSLHGHTMKIQG